MAVATNFSFVHCYQETVRRHDNLEILSSCFLIMADNTELVEIRTSLPRAGRPPHDFRSIWSSTDEGTCKPVVRKKMFAASFGFSLQVWKQESHLREENTLRESRGNTKT